MSQKLKAFLKAFFIFGVIFLLTPFSVKSDTIYDLPNDIEDSSQIQTVDRLEKINRSTYAINKGMDKILVLPGAKVYEKLTFVDWNRARVKNVLQNLYEPNRMINSIFYGKPGGFFTSAVRFLINSTFGLLGLFDPATKLGVKKYEISFREVMAEKLCVKNGDYFVIPMIGPSTSRNTIALLIDKFALDPFTFIWPIPATLTRFGAEIISTRYERRELIEQISQASIDEYAMVRGLYYQSDSAKEFDHCCKKVNKR